MSCTLYHSLYGSWFLQSECFDGLEHIHYTLTLARVNAVEERTEYGTPPDSVAMERERRDKDVETKDNVHVLISLPTK